MKFFNKMRWEFEKDLRNARIYKGTSIISLVSSKNVLDVHVTMLQKNLQSIKNRKTSNWTQDSESSDWSQPDAMTQRLQTDFEHLLLIRKNQSALMQSALTEESRNGNSQASTLEHLTLLSLLCTPLSFLSSLIGMVDLIYFELRMWYSMWPHSSVFVNQGFLKYIAHPTIHISSLTILGRNAIGALRIYPWNHLLSEQAKQKCQALLASARLNMGSVSRSVSVLAEQLGLKEPPLENGKQRIRWACVCIRSVSHGLSFKYSCVKLTSIMR